MEHSPHSNRPVTARTEINIRTLYGLTFYTYLSESKDNFILYALFPEAFCPNNDTTQCNFRIAVADHKTLYDYDKHDLQNKTRLEVIK